MFVKPLTQPSAEWAGGNNNNNSSGGGSSSNNMTALVGMSGVMYLSPAILLQPLRGPSQQVQAYMLIAI
jgi:hypothetical protein